MARAPRNENGKDVNAETCGTNHKTRRHNVASSPQKRNFTASKKKEKTSPKGFHQKQITKKKNLKGIFHHNNAPKPLAGDEFFSVFLQQTDHLPIRPTTALEV
jgi:hypothetical protein